MKTLITIAFILFIIGCVDKPTSHQYAPTTIKQTKTNISPNTFDTTLVPFKDSSYKLVLHIFNTKSGNQTMNNSTVTFTRDLINDKKIYFIDSLYCQYPEIVNKDFNGDGINDIQFFYSSGGRANLYYHLYVVDSFHHQLIRIKGFEKITSPDLDSANNIINCIGLYSIYSDYQFYRINSQNKLIDLKHSFDNEDGKDDSIKYARAIKLILKENKR